MKDYRVIYILIGTVGGFFAFEGGYMTGKMIVSAVIMAILAAITDGILHIQPFTKDAWKSIGWTSVGIVIGCLIAHI